MKSNYPAKSLAALIALTLLLTSCTVAEETVQDTAVASASVTSSAAETTSAPTAETSASATSAGSSETSLTEEEAVFSRYNSYTNTREDKLIPCDDGDQGAAVLGSIPGVKYVGKKRFFDEKEYLIFFEMPVYHADPSKGTFEQAVYVRYEGKDAPNVFVIDGYDLGWMVTSSYRDAGNYYDGSTFSENFEKFYSIGLKSNYFIAEYRFYGSSKPEEFGKDDLKFWACLNLEQASEDFHSIIENTKEVFSGRWCISGGSKGGEAVVYQLGKHPEDGDLFLAEAAMVFLNKNDPSLQEYAYTTAGDKHFGKKKAKEIRDLITEFQIECLKNRDKLVSRYYTFGKNSGNTFSSDLDREILFDCAVLDQVYYWQYLQEDQLDAIREALSKKDAKTHEEKEEYTNLLADALCTGYAPHQYALYKESSTLTEEDMYNYLFECYREDGYYGYDFSYLRKAIKESGSDAKLFVPEGLDLDLWTLRIDPEHRKTFSYDHSVLDVRTRTALTPSKHLIFINALTDIYQTEELKEINNSKVHIFNIPEASHAEAHPSDLKTKQRKEFDKLVRKYMGV